MLSAAVCMEFGAHLHKKHLQRRQVIRYGNEGERPTRSGYYLFFNELIELSRITLYIIGTLT